MFCDAWHAALAAGDDSAIAGALADPPTEISDAAAVVREAPQGSETSRAAAEERLLDWTQLHCRRLPPGASRRHIAPPSGSELDGLTFCGTPMPFPPPPGDDQAGMVLYGAAGAHDPYDGPMLGVFWTTGDGDHGGDGDRQPVTVRGQSGVAAPITVFQQTVLPELGTVIAWSEGGRALGLYGRQWPVERSNELVSIANHLEEVDGDHRIPDAALPDGYAEVFSGDPSILSIVLPFSSLYWVQYEGDDGRLSVHGRQMSEEEFEAFRFLTIRVDQGEARGHPALVGHAWGEDGPAVVTWREPDGLVVRILGMGVPLATARQVAERSRELTDEEWVALVEEDGRCGSN